MGCCTSAPIGTFPVKRLVPRINAPFPPNFPPGFVDPGWTQPFNEPTSKVVKRNEAGEFERLDLVLLIPHEGLRVDMLRASKIVREYLQPDNAQHVAAFFRWYDEYFYPALHDHHHSEESIMVPIARRVVESKGLKMNEVLPADELHTQHAELIRLLDGIKSARQTPHELVERWTAMESYMTEHLAEEEAKWPKVFALLGDAAMDEIHEEILKAGRGKKEFSLLFASIHDAMLCWASQEYYDAFLSKMPGIVLSCMAPGWVEEYHAYVELLSSIAAARPPAHPVAVAAVAE